MYELEFGRVIIVSRNHIDKQAKAYAEKSTIEIIDTKQFERVSDPQNSESVTTCNSNHINWLLKLETTR